MLTFYCHRIDENFVLKVSDFGLTEDVYSKHYFRHGSHEREEGEASVRLPVRWMAVESLHDGVFTEKTDVVRAQQHCSVLSSNAGIVSQ